MIVKNILKGKERVPGDGGHPVVTIGPDAPVADAARLLWARFIGAVVVVDDQGGIVGLLSERDIVRGVAERGAACLGDKVRNLMTGSVHVCHEGDTAAALMETMTRLRIRHLPVVDAGGRLIGIVTIGDVVKSRLDQAHLDMDNLVDYVATVR
jgi:CBS domain-containing protein